MSLYLDMWLRLDPMNRLSSTLDVILNPSLDLGTGGIMKLGDVAKPCHSYLV
jgi:hypothetical protein